MYRIGGKFQFHHSNIYNLFALQYSTVVLTIVMAARKSTQLKLIHSFMENYSYGPPNVYAICVMWITSALLFFIFFARCRLISLVRISRVPTEHPCMWIHGEQQFNDQKCTVHTQQPANRSFWFVKYIPSPGLFFFQSCSSIRFSCVHYTFSSVVYLQRYNGMCAMYIFNTM